MSYNRWSLKLQKEFQRLQQELIQCYRDRFSTIPVSTLALEYEVPLHEIYVRPAFVTLDLQRRFGNPTKTCVASLTDLFFRPVLEDGSHDREDFGYGREDSGAYKNIYVMADAGMGKTSFSKMICMAWCKAHDPVTSPDVRFQPEEIEAMKKFYFLFYISLRDSNSSFCDLDDIITELLKDYLPRKLDSKFLEEVFNAKPCLIILDGIDEWKHPDSCTRPHHDDDVPHRKCRRNWTILSTTRPWKFDFLRLASYQLDCHIDIKELDDRSLKQLVSNVVNLLNKNLPLGRPRKSVDDFYKTTSLTMLGEIRHYPYICLHCVCLWFEGKNIGDSKCEIYTNLIELAMKRGIQKIRPGSLPNLTQSSSESTVPKCMVNAHVQYCIQHLFLFQKLGRLALITLLGMEDKRCVIFEVEVATKYINQQELEYSVKTGILSQTKGYGSVARRISLVSFHHKTIQEYLAAFYLQSRYNEVPAVDANVQDILAQTLGSVLSILNVSNLLIFLSGLNSYAYKEIAAKAMNRVSVDESTGKYRKSVTSGSWPEYEVMFKYQTLQVSCAQEMKANGQEFFPPPLEDILINRLSNQEQYVTSLQDIIQGNHGNIKSLSVRAKGNPIEIRNIFGRFDLKYFYSLEKLELCDVTLKQQNLEQLLVQSVNTLRCLSLHYTIRRASLSKVCEETLLNMQLLQALSFEGLTLSHDQLEHVTMFISSSVTMTQIHMSYIDCSDHNQACPGAVLHLTDHENLQQLTLQHVPVSQLHLNPTHLEDCNIGHLPAAVVSSWLSCLPAAKSLRTFSCREFAGGEIATLTGIIPSLLQLEQISIHGMDLGERRLALTPEMIRLEYVELCEVSLTSSVVTGLLGTASLLPNSVRIALLDCTVTPDNEYQTIKEGIRRSGNFAILHDGPDNLGNPEFTFKILK